MVIRKLVIWKCKHKCKAELFFRWFLLRFFPHNLCWLLKFRLRYIWVHVIGLNCNIVLLCWTHLPPSSLFSLALSLPHRGNSLVCLCLFWRWKTPAHEHRNCNSFIPMSYGVFVGFTLNSQWSPVTSRRK